MLRDDEWFDYDFEVPDDCFMEPDLDPDDDELMRRVDEVTTDEVDNAVWLEEGEQPVCNEG